MSPESSIVPPTGEAVQAFSSRLSAACCTACPLTVSRSGKRDLPLKAELPTFDLALEKETKIVQIGAS